MAVRPRSNGDFGFQESAEINVTPFIDVLLVLLIIFMVVAPLSTTSVPMDLPVSSAAPPPPPDGKPIELSIGHEGGLFIGDQPVGSDLAQALAAHAATPETRILLRADKTTSYQELMALLDRVRAAGYVRLSLVGQSNADQ